jgi:lactate racemase
MRVTIAFDDLSVPLPPIQAPDPRQIVIEVLLEKLAARGVTDIHLVAATGLHRKMTAAELRRTLGARIYESFYPERLYCHDAEDKDGNQYLGKTDEGEVVELNRRAVTSDLLIYVNLCFSSMNGGHKSIQTGLSTYRSMRHHHNVECLMASESYMDPGRSALHAVLGRMGAVTNRNLNVFQVEMTLNNAAFPARLAFLGKPEHRYRLLDHAAFQLARATLELVPAGVTRRLFSRLAAPYGVTSIQAGRTEQVHEQALRNLLRQQQITVEGQSDILVAGLPNASPYSAGSLMNPVLAVNLAAGYLFNLSRGKPLVRRGGVMIVLHPLKREFDLKTHPSYLDFFDRVLADVRDPYLIENREEEFAANEEYIEAYQNGYAYHGVHPFHAWYWAVHGLEYLSRIIVVGARDAAVTDRIGWDRAATLREAVQMARTSLNQTDPSVTVFHWPPIFLPEVR